MIRKPIAGLATLLAFGLVACETPAEPNSGDLEDAVSLAVTGGSASWGELAGNTSAQLAPSSSTARFRVLNGDISITAGGPSVNASRYEDFENSASPPIGVCTGPITHLQNDACYATGEIVEGISLDNLESANDPLGGVVAIDPSLFGLPSTVVGPNFFTDGTQIDIGYGGAPTVFFSVYAPFHGPCWLLLDAYSGSTHLGSAVIWTGAGLSPALYGVFTGANMTRITLSQTDPCGELIDDVLAVR